MTLKCRWGSFALRSVACCYPSGVDLPPCQFWCLLSVTACVGIRHPEELSLARQLDSEELKRNQGVSAVRRTQIPGVTSSPNGHAPANNSYDSGTLSSPYRTTLTPQVTCVKLRLKRPLLRLMCIDDRQDYCAWNSKSTVLQSLLSWRPVRTCCCEPITELKNFASSLLRRLSKIRRNAICRAELWVRWNADTDARSVCYRKQIAPQLRTQYVQGVYSDSVTLKSRLWVTQDHWKRIHWIEHARLTISRVIWRWILLWPWNVVRGHSRSLKTVSFESLGAVSYSLSIVIMLLTCIVCEIATYWLKITRCLYPTQGVTPSEFCKDVWYS